MEFAVTESKFHFLEIKLEDQETKVLKFFEFWKMVVLMRGKFLSVCKFLEPSYRAKYIWQTDREYFYKLFQWLEKESIIR